MKCRTAIRLLELKRCHMATVHLISEIDTKQLSAGKHIECGDAGRRDDSCSGPYGA